MGEDSRISDLEEIKPAATSSNKKAGSNQKILSIEDKEEISDFNKSNNKKDNQKTNNATPKVVSSTPIVSAGNSTGMKQNKQQSVVKIPLKRKISLGSENDSEKHKKKKKKEFEKKKKKKKKKKK